MGFTVREDQNFVDRLDLKKSLGDNGVLIEFLCLASKYITPLDQPSSKDWQGTVTMATNYCDSKSIEER